MFRHLIKENNLDKLLKDNCINEEELEFINSLINPQIPVPDGKVIVILQP